MKKKNSEILKTLFETYPALQKCEEDITGVFELISQSYKNGGKLLICGNGGSAADCEHISGELLKSFKLKRPISPEKAQALSNYDNGEYMATHLEEGLTAIPLVSFTGLNTAFANDSAADMVYAQLVNVLGRKGDVLLSLSTSGNSTNAVNAIKVAKAQELICVGLSGRSGGLLNKLCDKCVCVPADETYAVQEYHLPVYHALCAMLEEEFFGE